MNDRPAPRPPRPRRQPCPLRHPRQRGAAVVTALLIVTLAVVVVSGLLWRQQVQIRSVENQRLVAQASWIERGALDWARLILRDDQRRTGGVDRLGEPWSVPVAETRLTDFLGAGLRTDTAGETSFLSGAIQDAQARYNLANLAVITAAVSGGTAVTVPPEELARFRRLLQTVGLNPALAEPTARYLASTLRTSGGGATPRPPDDISVLLAVQGYTPEMVQTLEPYVTVLPEVTKVNANTAEPEVLSAMFDKFPIDRARELVRQRDRAWFKNLGDVQNQLNTLASGVDQSTINNVLDVRSHYFLVYGMVRHERATRMRVSLVYRGEQVNNANTTRVVWTHDTDRLPAFQP